jgi:hypothetical protein
MPAPANEEAGGRDLRLVEDARDQDGKFESPEKLQAAFIASDQAKGVKIQGPRFRPIHGRATG